MFWQFWRKRYYVEIRFKSGNKFGYWTYKSSSLYKGDELVEIQYNFVSSLNQLQFISLKDIEHIGVIKSRGLFTYGS
jgi:hypothetical protein